MAEYLTLGTRVRVPPVLDLPGAPRRVIMHWTGCGVTASAYERQHYHYLVQQDGLIVVGVPVGNNMRKVGSEFPYAAHTKHFNSFSVGIAFCGMAGVKSRGDWNRGERGSAPLTESQLEAGCAFIGFCCREWGLAVSIDTVFTHAEAERLHGVDQDGKWDIDVLAFLPGKGAGEIGQWLRDRIARARAA